MLIFEVMAFVGAVLVGMGLMLGIAAVAFVILLLEGEEE